MELWKCVNRKQFANNEEFCDRGIDLKNCNGECKHNYTYGKWRELIKNRKFGGVVIEKKNRV